MTVIDTRSTTEVLVLDEVRRGLVEPAGGSRDLDATLEAARAAERRGAAAVVVRPANPDAGYWPATAQALAVLLATSRIRVVLTTPAATLDPEPLARFAASAVRLAGDRLVVRVLGDGAGAAADRLRSRWNGQVVVAAEQTAA